MTSQPYVPGRRLVGVNVHLVLALGCKEIGSDAKSDDNDQSDENAVSGEELILESSQDAGKRHIPLSHLDGRYRKNGMNAKGSVVMGLDGRV